MKSGRHQKLEQQYQSKETSEISLDSVRINNVVLVADAKSAEIFFSKIFPHFTECYVVSADGVYPENGDLKKYVLDELATSTSIAIVIFGADAYREMNIVSERILVLDRIIADCFSKIKIKSLSKKNFNEFDIIWLMMNFFDQWRIVHRSGNYSYQIRGNQEYVHSKMEWLLDLIAPSQKTALPKMQDYQVEDLEKLIFLPPVNKI